MTSASRVALSELVLGVTGNAITRRDERWYTHHSFGRIVALLAPRVKCLHYFAPQAVSEVAGSCDYPLGPENVVVHPWPVRRNSLQAVRRPDRLVRQYRRMTKGCDAFFLRGSQPMIWLIHLMAAIRRKPVVHWVVGNPVAIMKGEDRGYGRLTKLAGIAFVTLEQWMLKGSMRISGSRVLANGAELGGIYRSARTQSIISTSISAGDFLVREDTCLSDTVRLLFVGFVRPEKGLEYLLRALPIIAADKALQLSIVGSWDQHGGERERLDGIVRELGLEDRIRWEGYARYGAELFAHMDRSDVLVLPSLSEGTPRVLVEARARSLPIVSTTVGGIPSSVDAGEDGLLVPPRDSQALANAITSVINDGALRGRLIRAGRERVKLLTVERFVDVVADLFSGEPAEGS